MYDFKDYRDKSVREDMQLASQLQLEVMTAKIESQAIHQRLQELLTNAG
jgi:hypothetical protein